MVIIAQHWSCDFNMSSLNQYILEVIIAKKVLCEIWNFHGNWML
jgi:hypothetical protein